MKRYPQYKDSGALWLGQVPAHWPLVRYKYVFNERVPRKDSALPAGAISYGKVVLKDDDAMHVATKASYQEVLKGDFLVNPINLNYDLKSLRTALSEIDVCVSPAYIVLRPSIEADSSYLKHQLNVFDVSHMKTLGAGVRQTISFKDIGNCWTVMPPREEQEAISFYLDEEVGRIDAAISSQERMIELLKERRSTIITQAVTKGLDPKAKMKDSGVPWLGQVPAHWEVKALKHISATDSCGSYGLDEFQSEINMPVATTAQISKEGLFNVDDMPIRSFTHRELARFGCMTGDVLVVKSSGSASNIISGKAGLVEETTPKFVFSNFLLRLRVNKESACPYFIFSLLRSHLTRQRVELMCSTTTYPNLKIGEYVSAWLPVPPLVEQKAISLYLRRALGEIDSAVSSQERLIELLKERRSAIITQAVTGQIDVR